MTIVSRHSGRPLAADEHVGLYGHGTSQYDDDGEHYVTYRPGLLAEHTESYAAAGGILRPAASGSGLTWAVLSDGTAITVVCGEFIPIVTEDGPSDGRCGADATVDGMCEGHAEVAAACRAEWSHA